MLIPGLKAKKPLPETHEFRMKIVDLVTKEFGVPRHQIFFKTRRQPIVTCRHIAMYLMRTHETNSPLKDIGAYFKKDHTTVIHSCQSVRNLMDTDEVLREKVRKIESMI